MPKTPKSGAGETRPRKKRRWRRRLLILLGLLLVVGVVGNGPGARWAIRKVVVSQLAKQGAEGDLVVKGQILTGFTLSEADFAGPGPVRLVRFG